MASSGNIERIVDSDDEEDLLDSLNSLNVRDPLKESLGKNLCDRTEDDIKLLLEYMQCFPVFANMTLVVRRAMCATMQFAEVEEAGTVLMEDGEELDSWSVIIHGHIEVEHEGGRVEELHVGDSFGVTPTTEKMYHQGVMRTKEDNCQFVCILQSDYYKIFHPGEENTREQVEEREVAPVNEHQFSVRRSRRGRVFVRGTIGRLIPRSLAPNDIEVYFIEFINGDPQPVRERPLRRNTDPNLINKVLFIIR